MRVDGERERVRRVLTGERFAVEIDVEMVRPDFDPSELCMESETVEYLRQVQEHVDAGDVEWLRGAGKVYKALDAIERRGEVAA